MEYVVVDVLLTLTLTEFVTTLTTVLASTTSEEYVTEKALSTSVDVQTSQEVIVTVTVTSLTH